MSRRKKVILFDLDGTLLNSTELILRCFESSWLKILRKILDPQRYLQTMGIPLREAIRLLIREENRYLNESEIVAEDPLVETLVQEYRTWNAVYHDRFAKPFPGVQGALEQLKCRGYAIGVVSSKSRELGLRGLKLCGLEETIDHSVFLEDTSQHKPHPEPVLLALARFGISARSAAYVGDSRHDIQAGRASGVRTVAALWGPIPRAELEMDEPDELAETPFHLLEIFP